MDVTLFKVYRCVTCDNGGIAETITEHRYEGDIPDQSNCDLSTYSDHRITGGKLLAKKPELAWAITFLRNDESLPSSGISGGVCVQCLNNNPTVAVLVRGGHINFAEENNLKSSRW